MILSGNNWPLVTPLKSTSGAAGIILGPLAPKAGGAIDLLVMIPADRASGARDIATLTLSSPQGNTPLATATLTTVVSGPPPEKRLYLPLLIK